jgi:hypothetical protein
MFAALIVEQEFAALKDLPLYATSWLERAGVVAVFVLVVTELLRLAGNHGSCLTHGPGGGLRDLPPDQVWKRRVFGLLIFLIPIFMFVYVGSFVRLKMLQSDVQSRAQEMQGIQAEVASKKRTQASAQADLEKLHKEGLVSQEAAKSWAGTAATGSLLMSAFALLALAWEFLLDLGKLRWQRIWAVAKLSMIEAVRRKVLWGFAVLLGIVLFASWFIQATKIQDQWRTYVELVFVAVGLLMVFVSVVLACFSIPQDIKNQTIFTIVSKPIQRVELLLGRIFGVSLLMTLVLLVISHLSLLYLLREIHTASASETMRARIYLLGDFRFETQMTDGSFQQKETGTRVGQEWEYRSHIRGGGDVQEEAVWEFKNLPAMVHDPVWRKNNPFIEIEYNFDIFRLSRDRQDKGGVLSLFKLINTSRWDQTMDIRIRDQHRRDSAALRLEIPDEDAHIAEVAKRTGYIELPNIRVEDYHTQTLRLPTTLFEGLDKGVFQVRVSCLSNGQYLGMARHDLYLTLGNGSFYLNFLKGFVGLWAIVVIVIVIGTVASAYLSGPTAILIAVALLFGGLPDVREFLYSQSLAVSRANNPGGGPAESLYRLYNRDNLMVNVEENSFTRILLVIDSGFQVFVTGIMSVLPDLYQFNRVLHVREGFDIPFHEQGMSLLMLIGYLAPFLLMGYYLLNAREVAQV